MLAFWNGWYSGCRPCLTELAELAGKYEGKGVQFCTISWGDRIEAARQKATEWGIHLPVATDPSSSVGRRYGLKKMPQVVIIGRDGTVQFVRVFWPKGTQERIQRILDGMLAGKSVSEVDGPAGKAPASQPAEE